MSAVGSATVDGSAMPDDLPEADSLTWRDLGLDPSTDPVVDEEMAAEGMQRRRTLVSLRRPLPLDETTRGAITPIEVRAFDPAHDVEALLEVNNAAFDWHPDQGGWGRAELGHAISQRWVDTEGILVHDAADGSIDGFCWTRVHPPDDPEVMAAGDPPLGEIWVIAAHPKAHGRGLGPALVAAGLDHLASRGLRTSVLWTEESNLPARRMYDAMGFTLAARRGGYS
jgi:mycothiol synthase